MGNKEKLQVNNTNLRERILTTIQNLPGGVSYTGDNPLTVGSEGYTIPANTLIEEALRLVSGGVSGIDYGSITLSSSQTKVTVQHALNAVPTFAVLMKIVEDDNTNTVLYPRMYNSDYHNGMQSIIGKSTGVKGSTQYNGFTVNETSIEFITEQYKRFNSGEYFWIVKA